MRAMKDSGIEWIGQIPQEWDLIRAKHVATITNGSDPKTEGDIPVYGSGCESFRTCGEFKEGPAVLLGRKGATLHIPHYVEGKYWNVDTAFDVKTDEKQLDLEFYYFVSTCFDYKYYTATTTLPSMTQTNYGNMHIPFPSVEVQRHIVNGLKVKLESIDALLTAKEKTNALLKERRQSIIYEAVTKGLNPDAPMKGSGIEWIGEIPEHWDMLRLRFLGTFQNGISKAGEFFGSGYPFVSYGDVYKNEVLPTTPSGLVESTESEQELYSVEKGDVFFTRTSETKEEIGIVAVCKETIPNATFAGFLIRMRPTTNVVTTDFLRYYFSCGLQREYFSKEMTLVTRASLGQDLLKNMVVTIPSAEEQEAIVNYLDKQTQAIDSIIANNDVSVQKLKEYRQSIIYEAVTGKIEV